MWAPGTSIARKKIDNPETAAQLTKLSNAGDTLEPYQNAAYEAKCRFELADAQLKAAQAQVMLDFHQVKAAIIEQTKGTLDDDTPTKYQHTTCGYGIERKDDGHWYVAKFVIDPKDLNNGAATEGLDKPFPGMYL